MIHQQDPFVFQKIFLNEEKKHIARMGDDDNIHHNYRLENGFELKTFFLGNLHDQFDAYTNRNLTEKNVVNKIYKILLK